MCYKLWKVKQVAVIFCTTDVPDQESKDLITLPLSNLICLFHGTPTTSCLVTDVPKSSFILGSVLLILQNYQGFVFVLYQSKETEKKEIASLLSLSPVMHHNEK